MTEKRFIEPFKGIAAPECRGTPYPKYDPAKINESLFTMNAVNTILTNRALRLAHPEEVAEIVGGDFILAGGALSSDEFPKDFDIFCSSRMDTREIRNRIVRKSPQWVTLRETGNAVTAKHCGQIVQFCKYQAQSAEELISAFDFSHCQAAAIFGRDGSLSKTVSTGAFDSYLRYGQTKYTGSHYPLSSLMRCAKFISRGLIETDREWKPLICDILTDIVARGFEDEEDFKDQCTSISESFRDMNNDAWSLFELLRKPEQIGEKK